MERKQEIYCHGSRRKKHVTNRDDPKPVKGMILSCLSGR